MIILVILKKRSRSLWKVKNKIYEFSLLMDVFIGRGKKKRAKAFVTLRIMEDNPAGWTLHNKSLDAYIRKHAFLYEELSRLINLVNQPSILNIYVQGGGIQNQYDAIKTAIARAAQQTHPQVHTIMRTNNLVTCDSRRKERKKYGLRKARRAPQFSKR